jgi:serine/threonine protein kinase
MRSWQLTWLRALACCGVTRGWACFQCFVGLQVLGQVLKAVKRLHEQGYAHRNIKPSNILRRLKQHDWVLFDFASAAPLREHHPSSVCRLCKRAKLAIMGTAGNGCMQRLTAVNRAKSMHARFTAVKRAKRMHAKCYSDAAWHHAMCTMHWRLRREQLCQRLPSRLAESSFASGWPSRLAQSSFASG